MHRLVVFYKADYRLKQVGCAKSVETASENGREIRENVLRLHRYSYMNDTKWMVFSRTNLSHNDVNSHFCAKQNLLLGFMWFSAPVFGPCEIRSFFFILHNLSQLKNSNAFFRLINIRSCQSFPSIFLRRSDSGQNRMSLASSKKQSKTFYTFRHSNIGEVLFLLFNAKIKLKLKWRWKSGREIVDSCDQIKEQKSCYAKALNQTKVTIIQ